MSRYAVSTCNKKRSMQSGERTDKLIRRTTFTSSPGDISLRAMTCRTGSESGGWPLVLEERGNTMTALGTQEWLKRAAMGEIHVPRGSREGDASVKVLIVN